MSETVNREGATTRRRFMQHTGAAAAAATMAGAIGARAHAAAAETLKIGLIGCGGRGTGAAMQALSTSNDVQLVAMCDTFEDQIEFSAETIARQKKDQVNVGADDKYPGFDGYRGLLDRDDLDVVVIATPPGFRPIHFEYAVEKGRNVFMEKPVATDPRGVRRILAAAKIAKQKNLKIGVGLQRHHDAGYQETIKQIQDGAIGDVLAMRCYWNGDTPWVKGRDDLEKRYGRPLTEMEYQMRNWYFFNWICGDHIVEQHIHNLDVCNWVLGKYPTVAQGMGGRLVRTGADHGQIYDHHHVEFVYGDKLDSVPRMYSYCRHMPRCWNSVSEHAIGTKGYANVGGGRLYDHKDEEIWRLPRARRENPYQVEHDVLFDAIRNNKDHNEAENGAMATMTAILGRMCTYSGQIMPMERALNSEVDIFPHDPAFEWGWDANPPVMPDKDGRYPIPMPGEVKLV